MLNAENLPGSGIKHERSATATSGSHRINCRLWFFLLFFSVSTFSCVTDTDSDKDGTPDNKDRCPTQPAKTKNGCPPEEKIHTVRFFIDKSASMNGYYKGGTDFVHNIGDLLAKVDDIKPIKEIWQVSDSMELFSGTAEAFREQLPRIQPKGEKSSMMDKIFEKIAATTSNKDIAIFVSDGILSYPDQDIRKNKNINKESAQNLGTDIYTTFSHLKKQKDFGVSLYAFKSSFSGNYFNYQNGRVKLTAESRPYYIWIIGKTSLLRKFDTDLKGFSTFRPEHELHFGLTDSTVTKKEILSSADRTGQWTLSDDRKGIDNIGKDSIKFTIAIDLSSLPAYAQTISYLKSNLRPEPKDCTLSSLEIKEKQEVDITKIHSEKQKELLANATHVFIITLGHLTTQKASITITLPAATDNWYEDWSCDDDLNLKKDCAEKTFAFRFLVNGIKEAYEQSGQNYISISIPLTQ